MTRKKNQPREKTMSSKTTETEESQIGDVRHFKSSEFIQIDPPTDAVIEMWRDLFRRGETWAVVEPLEDPLSERERNLYNILTERLAAHFALLGMTVQELNEPKKEEEE